MLCILYRLLQTSLHRLFDRFPSTRKHKYIKLNDVFDTTILEMKELQNRMESCLQMLGFEKERLEKLHKYTKELLQELEMI